MPRLHLAVVVGLVALFAPLARGADAPAELLNTIIGKSEASRALIRSYAYGIEVQDQADAKADAAANVSTGVVKRRGDELYAVLSQLAENRTSRKIQPVESRLVVNQRYSAIWPLKGNPLAYQTDHTSIAEMDARTKARIQNHTPLDVLPYCFGDSARSFRESTALGVDSGGVKWDAIEAKAADGRPVYHVHRFMPAMNDATKPDAIWVVDPAMGHLATSMISYKADGRTWIEHHMQLGELAPAVWFPIAYQEKVHGERDAGTDDVTHSRRATLKDVAVNPELPDAQFDLTALRLRDEMPGIRILVRHLDGRTKSYVYDGNELVPESARSRQAP